MYRKATRSRTPSNRYGFLATLVRKLLLSKTAQSVMDGEENEEMGVGEDWVCFDVEKEYGGEEDEVLWPSGRTAWRTVQGKMEGMRRRG